MTGDEESPPRTNAPYATELDLTIAYGHDSGVVQAVHPASGTKQLGDTPAEAVAALWAILAESGWLE